MFYKQEYRIPKDGHPSEKAWDEITGLIINKLKILKPI